MCVLPKEGARREAGWCQNLLNPLQAWDRNTGSNCKHVLSFLTFAKILQYYVICLTSFFTSQQTFNIVSVDDMIQLNKIKLCSLRPGSCLQLEDVKRSDKDEKV